MEKASGAMVWRTVERQALKSREQHAMPKEHAHSSWLEPQRRFSIMQLVHCPRVFFSGPLNGGFHISQIDLSQYDQKTKLVVVIVDVFRELTLYFVSPCFCRGRHVRLYIRTQPSGKHAGHRASTVDGMQSVQRAGSVHGKHGRPSSR